MKIKRHSGYEDTVTLGSIHGAYPFKVYLELYSKTNTDQHIVVVSNKPIGNIENEVRVQFENSDSSKGVTNKTLLKLKSSAHLAKVLNPVEVRQRDLRLRVYEAVGKE